MRVPYILGSAAVACVLVGAIAAPAFAASAPSQPTSASVTGGSLTATLDAPVAFPAVDASHAASAAANQATSLDVNDLTGTGAGWNVTIVASDLDGTNFSTDPADLITAANVSLVSVDTLAGVTPTGGTAPSTTGITAGTAGAIGTATTILSAPAGDGVGEYTQGFTLGLNVPADSLADTYTGTVTLTVAPPT